MLQVTTHLWPGSTLQGYIQIMKFLIFPIWESIKGLFVLVKLVQIFHIAFVICEVKNSSITSSLLPFTSKHPWYSESFAGLQLSKEGENIDWRIATCMACWNLRQKHHPYNTIAYLHTLEANAQNHRIFSFSIECQCFKPSTTKK